MKKGLVIKCLLGLALIALLLYAGYRMVDYFADTIIMMLNNDVIYDGSGDYEMYTPEPMPTMPDYMKEDSFYDNADDVIFDGE